MVLHPLLETTVTVRSVPQTVDCDRLFEKREFVLKDQIGW